MANDVRWLDPDEQRAWRAWLDAHAHLAARLNRELRTILGMPDTRSRLSALGLETIPSTPEEHLAHLRAEFEILEGRDVAEAMGQTSWLPGELLICASSNAGPLRRVFLGDTSLKIVRAATSPVMILTRQA